MPVYRIYKLNAQGHLTGHALVLICEGRGCYPEG
jgi:hypothetical protein